MSPQSLYLAYFAVGGNRSAEDVSAWLDRRQAMPAGEYDRLAQAVNDEAAGRGIKYPLPCWDDDEEMDPLDPPEPPIDAGGHDVGSC